MLHLSRSGYLNNKMFFIIIFMVLTSISAEADMADSAVSKESLLVLTVFKQDITLLVNNSDTFEIQAQSPLNTNLSVRLLQKPDDLIHMEPTDLFFKADLQEKFNVNVVGLQPGHTEITAESQIPNMVSNIIVRITVANTEWIIYVATIVGWIYFFAWSVSFYPQIFTNYQRKSVVGLNFDFITLNIVGFVLYSIFNCGLYWIPAIQAQYSEQYPTSLNPVLLNDVVFSLHAVCATLITIVQCCIYERGQQRVSVFARGLLIAFGVIVTLSALLAIFNSLTWLQFLYYCSYIKLAITIIKYVPQALMNYQRKSTVGWSIGNILLDFTGGMLSMLQMILNAYNYNDWISIFGDPTKFGLGLFSVLFDIFFMLQHYVFYRNSEENAIKLNTKENDLEIPTFEEQHI